MITFGAEPGSYKAILGIVCGAVLFLTQFLETDFGSGFFKGLLGQDLDYKKSGENVGMFLRDLIVSFYSTETHKLEKIIPLSVNLDKALSAKNDFYWMCLNNKNISAIGFTDCPDFPIKRQVFTQHLSKKKVPHGASASELCEAIIVSPVNIDINHAWLF